MKFPVDPNDPPFSLVMEVKVFPAVSVNATVWLKSSLQTSKHTRAFPAETLNAEVVTVPTPAPPDE
jgi:hypothetical protein